MDKQAQAQQPPPYNAGYPPPQYPPQQGYPPPPQQGYPPQQYPPQQVVVVQQQPAQNVNSNSLLAWISCLCFFWPLGLVAVVKANKSDQCLGRGDIAGARENGEAAKKWAIAAIVTQIVFGAIAGVIYVIYIVWIVNTINNSYDSDYYG